ncbi:MAG: DUF3560 domain-containing protein [Clostridia bacterium]|nr:DUF3560 domain-containing protein [Clostridia bacterium]
MNQYEEKRQARIDRLKNAAKRAEKEAIETFESANKMADAIPFGQPILIGHHSEQRDRRYRNRISNKFDKAMEGYDRAEKLRAKAAAAENNNAISSDDPEAIQKLKAKLETLEAWHEEMKAVNKFYRKHGTCVGYEGLSKEQAEKYDADVEKGYSWEKQPFPSFHLTNNLSSIKQVKDRIKELESKDELSFEPIEFDGGRIEANKEINRIQIFFDDIPNEEIRSEMKSRGFHFSKYNGNAWQRQLNSNGLYAAKKVLEKIENYQEEQEQGPTMDM